jgi:hypothetical protein
MPGYNSPRGARPAPFRNFCVFLCITCFVPFCVFVCKYVLYYCHRVATQLQLTKISYHFISLYRIPLVLVTPWINDGNVASCIYTLQQQQLLLLRHITLPSFWIPCYRSRAAQLLSSTNPSYIAWAPNRLLICPSLLKLLFR